jgi:hypothetical protein
MGEIHLDTDILIDLLEKYDKQLIIDLLLSYDLKISSIVYYEFCIGIYRTGMKYLKSFINKYFEVIPFSREIADKTAEIQAELMDRGMLMDHRDIIIGVTAILSNAQLWTKNIKHFKRLEEYGLKIFKKRETDR